MKETLPLTPILIFGLFAHIALGWGIAGLFIHDKFMKEAQTPSQIVLAILVGGPIVWGCILSKLTIEAAFMKVWNYFGKK